MKFVTRHSSHRYFFLRGIQRATRRRRAIAERRSNEFA